jgi:methyltransferase (TIGR00027 family)
MSPNVAQPVARTAFYCCAIRATDAAAPKPVCGDRFAARFLDEQIREDVAPLVRHKKPAASNVARHRIIDDLTRDRLKADPAMRVILIGAGFDTRAFRLQGGRWFELDDPQLLAFKDERLRSAEAANPLTRTPVTFRLEPPTRYLAPLAGDDRALVLLEGVSMYLSDDTLQRLATAIAEALPKATIICDLMSAAFATRFSAALHRDLKKMGAAFGERQGHPSLAFEAAGYRATRTISIADRAREAGTMWIPTWLMNTFLRELRDGYMVWVFERS